MNSRDAEQREILQILITANCGEATEEQIARVEELIQGDHHLAAYAAQVLDQQGALAWQGECLHDRLLSPASVPEDAGETARDSAGAATAPAAGKRLSFLHGNWPTIAVGISFALGALASLVVGRMAGPADPQSASAELSPSKAVYEARLVRTTACLWEGGAGGARSVGSGLRSGESLHLLQGLAEFSLNWSDGDSATILMEGPAAMLLTSEGMPMLRFGRLTATINAGHRPFVLETPVGQLELADYGSIGVSAFGNDAEIHVFDGVATLEPTWPSSHGMQDVPRQIVAGEAIRVETGHSGEVAVTQHPTDEGYFAAQVSMASDPLIVPPEYVDAVKQAAPIAYWRFERRHWPAVPNEIGDHHDCYLKGSIGTTSYAGNQALEFGVTNREGEIGVEHALDELDGDSYSIEFWVKPSHYHLGAIVALVDKRNAPNGVVPHALLFELCGSGRVPSAVRHPGRIRFLHRSPAGNKLAMGTSCYSDEAYTLRKWQHVVGVKQGQSMRLYVNGELTGEEVDASELPSGLHLVIGRLYPSRRVRPFIGQLDELSLYDRALSREEITRHYELLRPTIPAAKNI